jgi:hypothetical protein
MSYSTACGPAVIAGDGFHVRPAQQHVPSSYAAAGRPWRAAWVK